MLAATTEHVRSPLLPPWTLASLWPLAGNSTGNWLPSCERRPGMTLDGGQMLRGRGLTGGVLGLALAAMGSTVGAQDALSTYGLPEPWTCPRRARSGMASSPSRRPTSTRSSAPRSRSRSPRGSSAPFGIRCSRTTSRRGTSTTAASTCASPMAEVGRVRPPSSSGSRISEGPASMAASSSSRRSRSPPASASPRASAGAATRAAAGFATPWRRSATRSPTAPTRRGRGDGSRRRRALLPRRRSAVRRRGVAVDRPPAAGGRVLVGRLRPGGRADRLRGPLAGQRGLTWRVRPGLDLTAYALQGAAVGAVLSFRFDAAQDPVPGGAEPAPPPIGQRPAPGTSVPAAGPLDAAFAREGARGLESTVTGSDRAAGARQRPLRRGARGDRPRGPHPRQRPARRGRSLTASANLHSCASDRPRVRTCKPSCGAAA